MDQTSLRSSQALAAAVAALHARQPTRVWSLIVSFIGDAILPRGGSVQAGVISAFCGLAGVEAGLVRTALSRLVAKGIVARERHGRRSFYHLTAEETLAFSRAADLIYGRAIPQPTGAWDLVSIDALPDRAAARLDLVKAGYAALGAASFIRPQHAGRDADPSGGIGFVAWPNGAAEVLTALWPLDDIAASYRRFLLRYAPFTDASGLTPADALLARVLLVHDFRRILLRDPFAPAAALPADWPAEAARTLFNVAYHALTPAAEMSLEQLCQPGHSAHQDM